MPISRSEIRPTEVHSKRNTGSNMAHKIPGRISPTLLGRLRPAESLTAPARCRPESSNRTMEPARHSAIPTNLMIQRLEKEV
jgi:hypothetical protein